MFHIDTPTPRDLANLSKTRADACVSLYLPTTPHTQDVSASRIEFGNLAKAALDQLEDKRFDKRRLAALREGLDAVADDDDFWRLQARSLAVLATPERVVTFRLANRLSALSEVSDRFHLNPLLRAVAFPHGALVLAVSENGVRLIEAPSDLPAVEVKVPDLPKDAASHAHKATLNDRSPSGRIQGAEGQRIRHLQYLRAIDAALRPALAGRDTPLIVAAVDPLASLFPKVNSYARLLPDVLRESPDRMSAAELAEKAIPLLDSAYARELAELHRLFDERTGQGRTATDVTDAARAATFGAVDTLFVDMDEAAPGTIDDDGQVSFADASGADSYGIVDEIAARVMAAGGRVLAVRRDEVPGGGGVAAILRYPV